MKRALEVIGNVVVWTLTIAVLFGMGFVYMWGISSERTNCETAGGVYISGGMFGGATCAIGTPETEKQQ